LLDLKLNGGTPEWLAERLDELAPDLVGVSALNCEAQASHEIAARVKDWNPDTLTVLGGPYAHKRAEEILTSSQFDWVFGGEADATFPEAIARCLKGEPLGEDLAGFSYGYRDDRGTRHIHLSEAQDALKDLDALGHPAWDLVDFDAYAARPNMAGVQKGRRYATIFTSRGCPYLCSYCHDIFGKRFIWRSAEHVLEEIELLRSEYDVDEIQIVDDIFNLNKPRLRTIMAESERRWQGNMAFSFPNGVRADIMDEEIVEALYRGGTYFVSIAIETVTERLQKLVTKNLDVSRAERVIGYCHDRGMITRGFFMLGFPTETPKEIRATLDFAFRSQLTIAFFFTVTPQPATPLYSLAMEEAPDALREAEQSEREGHGYRNDDAWYQRAYGYNLARTIRFAYARFFLTPRRGWQILRRIPRRYQIIGTKSFLRFVVRRLPELKGQRGETKPLPPRGLESRA
ncbi:MAG: radical SAM protein, partial [Planctomycetota bacterium]